MHRKEDTLSPERSAWETAAREFVALHYVDWQSNQLIQKGEFDRRWRVEEGADADGIADPGRVPLRLALHQWCPGPDPAARLTHWAIRWAFWELSQGDVPPPDLDLLMN